jgi:uncharacterized damage-inducible protein DinB
MHIAGGNYYLPTFIGIKAPEGMKADAEKTVTNKAEIAKALKASFDHLRNVVTSVSGADLDKTAEFFGNKMTYRNLLITCVAHLHEHLGQAIAYARSNNVVPPWTAAMQSQQDANTDSK